MSNRAWVTLATNDSYGLGALVLAHSLRRAGSLYPAAVLITPSVTEAMRERLRAVFAEVVTVDVLDSKDAAHLALLQRPELGITFTKIHCWGLTQYEKCVFLDADTLVVQNCDELFEREELSAAPDVGWPDCFNSGVFVYQPSQETFENLIKFAQERGSFDGGDQGLLNAFFSDWARGDINKHLPFLYNVTSAAFYSYIPALKHYGQNLKIIHFIGAAKPWLQQYNWESRSVDVPEHLREFLQLWWDLFVGQVHSQLDVTMVEVSEAPPALPPPDLGHHYTPVVDPDSEFPWHHPDAQAQETTQRPVIDMEQFHDPWAIYGGQIPSYKDDVTQEPLTGRAEDHEEMKKYAWDYEPPRQSDYHDYQQEQPHQHFEHSHHESQHHWEAQSHHSYGQDHGHDHSSHHHSHDQHHQPQVYHPHIQQHYSHWQPEPQSSQQHEHHEDHSAQHSAQHHHSQQHEYYDQGHVQHSHDHHHTHSSHMHDHHKHHNQPDNQHSHGSEGFSTKVNNNQDHAPSIAKLVSHNINTVQQVHHVHVNHEVPNHVHVHHEVPNHVEHNGSENEMMNGDISETESEFHEEIKPRHPYDGYYLRHRAVIDSLGRKMCTHEIPPTPTPSPPPEYECEDPFSLPEEIPLTNGYDEEEQSGVAGNLARVVPGAAGVQREALDELTRRQGWEAGNIDYMGADSFDNIWAKISQTLSQPRQLSPPKQPSPPKETPVEVAQEASVVDQDKPEAPAAETAPAPVEVAVSAPTADAAPAPAVETAAGEAKPTIVEAALAAVELAPTPAEIVPTTVKAAPTPAEVVPTTVEAAPAAVETAPAPAEVVPTTVEAAAVEAAPASAEVVPAPVEAAPVATAPAPAPVEAVPVPAAEAAPAAPEAAPAPVETAPAPTEAAPAPVEAAAEVPVEAPKPTGAAPLTESPAATETKAPEAAPKAPAPVEVPTTVEAATESKPAALLASEIPATVAAIASTPAASDIPATVEACAPGEAPAPAVASKPEPPKEEAKTEPTLPPTPPASPKSPEEPVESPVAPVEAAKEAAPVVPEPCPASPVSPAAAAPVAAEPAATPETPSEAPVASDSPPLANTPSKEDAPAPPAAKSTEEAAQETRL